MGDARQISRVVVNIEQEPRRAKCKSTTRGLVVPRLVWGKPATQDRKAAMVPDAVEKRGRAIGRARRAVIPDFKRTTRISFLKQNVAPDLN